jgi:hypothetical protein
MLLSFSLQYVFSFSILKGPVSQRVIGTSVKASGAGKAVGLEGLSLKNPFSRPRRTGPAAFSTIEAGIAIYFNPEDTQFLNHPTEQPEGAYKHAVGAVIEYG